MTSKYGHDDWWWMIGEQVVQNMTGYLEQNSSSLLSMYISSLQ